MTKKNKSRLKTIMLIFIIPLVLGITASLAAAHIDRHFSAETALSPAVEPTVVYTPEGAKTEKFIIKFIIEKNTEFVKTQNQSSTKDKSD